MSQITINTEHILNIRRMRAAQHRYFVHRYPSDLKEAKRYEQLVDEWLAHIAQEVTDRTKGELAQNRLFSLDETNPQHPVTPE